MFYWIAENLFSNIFKHLPYKRYHNWTFDFISIQKPKISRPMEWKKFKYIQVPDKVDDRQFFNVVLGPKNTNTMRYATWPLFAFFWAYTICKWRQKARNIFSRVFYLLKEKKWLGDKINKNMKFLRTNNLMTE